MVKVLAWSDDDALCKEVRTKAKTLGEAVTLDRSDLPDDDTMTIAAALKAAVEESGADLVLIGASKKGKDIAPRLSALLDWPYAAEVQRIEHGDAGWSVDRMVLSGNSMATYEMGDKAVATATPGTFEAEGDPELPKVKPTGIEASPLKIVDTKGESDSTFDLGSADVVIGVGRGFKKEEDIQIAKDLAAAFKGGAIGCSRPISADLKWLGEEYWIGLSGHEIKPQMYLAAGVSGQIQHIAGIRGSKLIVAVNTNKDAPIFGVCDYGIVGDLYKVLPALAERLKK